MVGAVGLGGVWMGTTGGRRINKRECMARGGIRLRVCLFCCLVAVTLRYTALVGAICGELPFLFFLFFLGW